MENLEAAQSFLAKNPILLDVRTPEEVSNEPVPTAINIPLDALEERSSELDKERPILVFCRSGMRAERAKMWLLSKGFTAVVNGGSWQAVEELRTSQLKK